MNKNNYLIIICILAYTLKLHAQQNSDPSHSIGISKNWSVGIGHSILILDDEKLNFGGNFKLDYNLNDEWSIGNRILVGFGLPSSSFTDTFANYTITSVFRDHYELNVLIGLNYRILGKKKYTKGFEVYAAMGLDYHYNSSIYETIDNRPRTDPDFDSRQYKSTSSDFGFYAAIGLDYAAGPGKIYLEIPFIFNVYEISEIKTISILTNKTEVSPHDIEPTSDWLEGIELQGVYFNFGYQIYF